MEIDKFQAAKPLATAIDTVAALQEQVGRLGRKGENGEETSLWGWLLVHQQSLHNISVDISDIEGKVKAELFNRLASKRTELYEKFKAL
jgi:hypothetical protein